MNIVFVSNLSGNLFAGPNNSVPAQVKAQSKVDNVFWYNINENIREEWIEIGCKTTKDYPNKVLSDLPDPFNKPDVVVFEEFYCFPFSRIVREVMANKIPYVIIPRSELTQKAQEKKYLKKIIGNLLFFNNFAKKASMIQYLSIQESIDSGDRWNKNSRVIPNGTYEKTFVKTSFNCDCIRAVYIGRYEIYQKGLDLLLEAITKEKDLLTREKFVFDLYGVDQENTVNKLYKLIEENGLEQIVNIHDSVYGSEKEAILLAADIFIMTSRFEGMPMGMIEALSYGLPALATTGTNMADEIASENAGWSADNSVESIMQAFRNVIKNKDNLPEFSENAVKLSKCYSWNNISIKSHDMYESIIRS